jgi:hypothetical protein
MYRYHHSTHWYPCAVSITSTWTWYTFFHHHKVSPTCSLFWTEFLAGLKPSLLPPPRVSFETSFDSKQPKLETKLVSALSKTKCLFRLFRFYTETESFDVSIELKQTEDQPKQFDREHILIFFTKNSGFFQFFRYFLSFFRFFLFFLFVSKQFVSVVSLLYRNRDFQCFD